MGDLVFLNRVRLDAASGNADSRRRLSPADKWYREGCRLDEDPSTLARAEKCYLKALDLDARHTGSLVNLGNVMARGGRYAVAECHYRTALATDVNHADAWYNLGFVRFTLRDDKTAALYFQRVITLSPGYVDAYYNCGAALEGCGEHALAAWHFDQYMRLAPDGEWFDHARRYLDRLKEE